MYPIAAKLFPGRVPQKAVCHCLLIETEKKLVLVDTGFSTKDVKDPSRLGLVRHVLGIENTASLTAIRQIKKLGFKPKDVTDIIVTHLDFDHAGGALDFPWAAVHTAEEELQALRDKDNFSFRSRYHDYQRAAKTKWRTFRLGKGERWNGFPCVRDIPGIPPDVLLVDLPGHTPGHFGVAVTGEKTLLHAGDAYFIHDEMEGSGKSPLGVKLFEQLTHWKWDVAMETQERLRKLRAKKDISIFCSHDYSEWQSISDNSTP